MRVSEINEPAADLIRHFARPLAVTVMLIHLVEYWFLMTPLMDFYRVPADAKWKWALSCAFEGAVAYFRLRDNGRRLLQH